MTKKEITMKKTRRVFGDTSKSKRINCQSEHHFVSVQYEFENGAIINSANVGYCPDTDDEKVLNARIKKAFREAEKSILEITYQ